MKRSPTFLIAGALLPVMALTSCESPDPYYEGYQRGGYYDDPRGGYYDDGPRPGSAAKKGAIVGGAVGAVTQGNLRGAVAGGAIGAAAGALIGAIIRDSERRRYGYRQGRTPWARATQEAGFVVSPYPPYNLIDVRGIPRGATVLDPSTNRLFLNP